MDDDELYRAAEAAGLALLSRGWMLATAESCTGGWIGQAVTAVAGSSAWYDRGFVTYSNESKQEMLGVCAETLIRYGAVSEETAAEMVRGVLGASRAHVAVSVTGIAGPAGGSPDKPVGTVCFAWGIGDGAIRTERRLFPGARRDIRRQAALHALRGVSALVQT